MLDTGPEPEVADAGREVPAPSPAERPVRKIIHVDMDAFYASVEQRDDPSLRGRPIAVGGSRERGVVAAASYEARKYGVRSAMPSVTARRKCPDLVFVKPRFDVYREVSAAIRAIFADYTPLIEPLSLDEAYLDVTENLRGIPTATEIAKEIKARIRSELDLPASAGVAYAKFLAKLASDHRKPDGLFVITPRMGPDFVLDLPIGRFHGIGPATEAKMKALGINTGADLRSKPLDFLQQHFGKSGGYFWGISRGIDDRPVRPDRIRKSIGAEATFETDLREFDDLRERLQPILDKVWSRMEANGAKGRTVTLKLKFSDFSQITRARSLQVPVAGREACEAIVLDLLREAYPLRLSVRLIGFTMSGLGDEVDAVQLRMDL
ncbi:DNA polymerase IV [Methylobacterium brachiatum]